MKTFMGAGLVDNDTYPSKVTTPSSATVTMMKHAQKSKTTTNTNNLRLTFPTKVTDASTNAVEFYIPIALPGATTGSDQANIVCWYSIYTDSSTDDLRYQQTIYEE